MSISLRTYFILIFTAFVIVFTSFIGYFVNRESSQSVGKAISESLTEKAYQMAERLDQFMWSRYGEITVLSNLETLKESHAAGDIRTLLNELKANFPSFSWVGYTDSKGKVIASTDDILVGKDISERPVFMEATKETFIGDVHEAVLLAKLLPNPSGEPLQFVDISSPIFNDEGEFKGVLAAHLSWEWAQEVRKSVFQPLNKKEELEVFIVSKKDQTILLGPKSMVGQQLKLDAVDQALSGKNSWTLEKWPDGKKYLTGYALADGFLNYQGLDWTVIVRQPEEVAFYNVKELSEDILVIGLISSLIFAVIGWFLAQVISNPLRQLAVTTERLRGGERAEIPIKRGIREIEILSTSLRDLIKTLTRTETDLGKMESMAQLDKLTGLPNRLALDTYLDNLRDTNQYAFLYMDLDGFKNVNDTYGHHHGDLLLKIVANRIKGCVRSHEFVCRLGGDEFVILLEISGDVENVTRVANRIIASINEPANIEGSIVKVECSIGAALWPAQDGNPSQVLRYADKALYQSKENGKNRLTYYEK